MRAELNFRKDLSNYKNRESKVKSRIERKKKPSFDGQDDDD